MDFWGLVSLNRLQDNDALKVWGRGHPIQGLGIERKAQGLCPVTRGLGHGTLGSKLCVGDVVPAGSKHECVGCRAWQDEVAVRVTTIQEGG